MPGRGVKRLFFFCARVLPFAITSQQIFVREQHVYENEELMPESRKVIALS